MEDNLNLKLRVERGDRRKDETAALRLSRSRKQMMDRRTSC